MRVSVSAGFWQFWNVFFKEIQFVNISRVEFNWLNIFPLEKPASFVNRRNKRWANSRISVRVNVLVFFRHRKQFREWQSSFSYFYWKLWNGQIFSSKSHIHRVTENSFCHSGVLFLVNWEGNCNHFWRSDIREILIFSVFELKQLFYQSIQR